MALEVETAKIPRYHVLVADDHISIRELIVLCLSKQGHQCITARNGTEVLKKINQNKFDAVITDLAMPEIDGISLTKELLSLCPKLPIMVMTGYTKEYSVESARKAGVRGFIWKPFRIDDFILRFNEMMANHEMPS
jgi:CheY-like chemotaxis protein